MQPNEIAAIYDREDDIKKLIEKHKLTRQQAKGVTFAKAYGMGETEAVEFQKSKSLAHNIMAKIQKRVLHDGWVVKEEVRVAKRYRVKNRG